MSNAKPVEKYIVLVEFEDRNYQKWNRKILSGKAFWKIYIFNLDFDKVFI